MNEWPEWVWDEAMRLHGETTVVGQELTEDVDGRPLGVQQRTMHGYIIDHSEMERIYNEGKPS